MSTALLSDLLYARMTGRLDDLLLLAFDSGVQYGGGLPLERHSDPTIEALLRQTIDRWHRESQALSAWSDGAAAEAPAWLRRQQEVQP